MSQETILELKAVTKTFKQTEVISAMDLAIKTGEFLVLLGPSGCGKSTTLRMIAGLETPSSGEILLNGSDATKISSAKRNIAMVFQDYALYPNMTVYQNLDYALKVHKVDKQIRQQRLTKVLQTLNLEKYRDRLPAQLSGGQKQRVALGRGMAKQSEIFLLDEPLSNIDVQLREKARDEIQHLHEESQQTIVYVTHDQLEAMALGDRIAIINDGKIQMIDTPDNIYHHPANLFVAQFIGTPQINVLPVTYAHEQVQFDGQCLFDQMPRLTQLKSGELMLGIRPEHIQLSHDQGPLAATIDQVVDYGRYQQFSVTLTSGENLKVVATTDEFQVGEQVRLTFSTTRSLFFNRETQRNVEA